MAILHPTAGRKTWPDGEGDSTVDTVLTLTGISTGRKQVKQLQNRLLTASSFAAYFLIGFTSVMFAPALPAMIEGFRLTLGRAALVFPAMSAGSLVAVLVGGTLSDRIGRKSPIILGSTILSLSYILIGTAGSWTIVLAAFLASSVGHGFVNPCVNALISDVNPGRRGAAFNALHGIYGLGGLLGPVVTGGFLVTTWGWRPLFWITGIIWLIYSTFVSLLTFPAPRLQADTVKGHLPKMGIVVVALASIAFIYNGTAWALIGWINTYIQQAEILPTILSAGIVSLFYVTLTAGRFLWSRYADSLGHVRVILICATGSAIAYPWVIWTSSPLTVTLGVITSGLFFSGLYPTALACATNRWPHLAGTVSGAMSIAMTLGKMLVPWITGIIAQVTGLKTGLRCNYVLLLLLVADAVLILRNQHRFMPAPAGPQETCRPAEYPAKEIR